MFYAKYMFNLVELALCPPTWGLALHCTFTDRVVLIHGDRRFVLFTYFLNVSLLLATFARLLTGETGRTNRRVI